MASKIVEALAQLGFTEWQTGGGCTAMGRNLDAREPWDGSSKGYLMVTEGDEACSPTDGNPVTVGLYLGDDEGNDRFAVFTFPEGQAAVAWIRVAINAYSCTGAC